MIRSKRKLLELVILEYHLRNFSPQSSQEAAIVIRCLTQVLDAHSAHHVQVLCVSLRLQEIARHFSSLCFKPQCADLQILLNISDNEEPKGMSIVLAYHENQNIENFSPIQTVNLTILNFKTLLTT